MVFIDNWHEERQNFSLSAEPIVVLVQEHIKALAGVVWATAPAQQFGEQWD